MARRGPTCCESLIAFVLKFLNYLQTFLGVSIVIYSCFMLNHWHHHHSSVPSSPPHSTHSPLSPSHFSHNLHNLDLNFAADVVLDASLINGLQFISHSLPKPCLVTFIAIDRQWETDLPVDSTGELDRLRTFFQQNRDFFEWIGIAVVIIQVLSLLLSMILRALVNQKEDLDSERVYDIRERPWEPLLHPHLSQAFGSIRSDGRGTHSDIWSSRMREKYGLNGGDSKQNLPNQNFSVDQNPRN